MEKKKIIFIVGILIVVLLLCALKIFNEPTQNYSKPSVAMPENILYQNEVEENIVNELYMVDELNLE